MTQSSYRTWKNKSNYYRFGIDYQMSEKTTIGLSTDGNLAGSKVEGDMNYIHFLSDLRKPEVCFVP